jgi:hypothetical protein
MKTDKLQKFTELSYKDKTLTIGNFWVILYLIVLFVNWYPHGWIHKSIEKMHQRDLQLQRLDSLKQEVYKLDRQY